MFPLLAHKGESRLNGVASWEERTYSITTNLVDRLQLVKPVRHGLRLHATMYVQDVRATCLHVTKLRALFRVTEALACV